jgi:hypothetical protein
MIPDLQKHSACLKIIQYHELKCEKGDAELIYNNTQADDLEEKVAELESTVSLNNRVRSNKYAHISLNLNPKDAQLSNDKLVELAQAYLDGMGFTDVPYYVYKHMDKEHLHVHIVTTTIRNDGSKVSDFDDHRRSQQLALELETKFALVPTVYKQTGTDKINQKNAERYNVYTACIKAMGDEDHQDAVKDLIGGMMYKRIASATKPLDNQTVKSLLRENYEFLASYLYREKLLVRTKKSTLIEKLDYILSMSKSNDEFLKRCSDFGLYARRLVQNDKPYIIYGLPEDGFYIRENKLPGRFRFASLGQAQINTFNEDRQIQYLKKSVYSILALCSSYEQFKATLALNKISVKLAKHQNGNAYGISFQLENVPNPVWIKGSDLSKALSFAAIQKRIGRSASKVNTQVRVKGEKLLVSTSKTPTDVKPILPKAAPAAQESEEQARRRRKKMENDLKDDIGM